MVVMSIVGMWWFVDESGTVGVRAGCSYVVCKEQQGV